MGIIKAVGSAISGGFADQWLETIEASDMSDHTVFASGVKIRKGQNTKGTDNLVSNGSMIHLKDNQFMMLVDGGKVVDYTAEPGYYQVNNSSAPSLFNGQFGDAIKESFNRIKFGGETPYKQQVYFINLQEIKGIKFGTRNPVNYFDSFYNAELFLRTHGTYSIKITDPLKFYAEVIPKNKSKVDFEEINEQYTDEFLSALQSSINQMSADGIRISFVSSKGRELGKYMAETLDEDWTKTRGMEIQSVGIGSISYTEDSQDLINLRNQGAMMSDPSIREGYVQKNIAEGLKAAGSNKNGSMSGFMGMGLGMQTGGNFMAAASQSNMQQMKQSEPVKMEPVTKNTWKCSCGAENVGKFCPECGAKKPENKTWICSCGNTNTGKFCSECGKERPNQSSWVCECGAVNTGKFCPECGKMRP
jgi:membrane protease subunit (stomatin/prohibitin family)